MYIKTYLCVCMLGVSVCMFLLVLAHLGPESRKTVVCVSVSVCVCMCMSVCVFTMVPIVVKLAVQSGFFRWFTSPALMSVFTKIFFKHLATVCTRYIVSCSGTGRQHPKH